MDCGLRYVNAKSAFAGISANQPPIRNVFDLGVNDFGSRTSEIQKEIPFVVDHMYRESCSPHSLHMAYLKLFPPYP